MDIKEIKSLYCSIMKQEKIANNRIWSKSIYNADEMYNTALRLLEVAKLSMLSRSYNENYHLTNTSIAYESVAAHTNLMMALVDFAIKFECDDMISTESLYGFTYREIIEAVRRHDMPENEIGDIPDDGRRDDAAKADEEEAYWQKYSALSPIGELTFEIHVNRVLGYMNKRVTAVGRLLHVADKVSGILAVLRYDLDGYPPIKTFEDKGISKSDSIAMKLCDHQEHGICKASEMWSIVYFKIRRTCKYDDTGYITGILVMTTLIVNGKWYKWRTADYS